MQNKTALLVDDSRVARMTLGKLLKAQDFEVIELDSGEAALDWLQKAPTSPQIVFMDVTMGGMDGLTACREIKAQQDLASIPVVICTGNDSEEGLESALSSGAIAVLSKPPAAEALQALLDNVSVTVEAADIQQPSEAATVTDEQATLDMDAMLTALRQQLVPELQAMTTEISRDIAEKTAQETSHKQGLSLVPDISRQVSESVQQQIVEMQQNLSSQTGDIVSRTAGQAIDSALQNYGLTEKVMVMLRSEGMNWLNKQQDVIREDLLKQAQQDLMPMVSRCLDQQLNERVQPLVKSQLAEAQQELETKQQEQLSQLQSAFKQQRLVAFGALTLAVVAVVLTLL